MKIFKEKNTIEVAEFATAHDIADEPTFCWWVPYTLRKRDSIIAAVTSLAINIPHNYGIEVPHDLDNSNQLNPTNGNNLWKEEI